MNAFDQLSAQLGVVADGKISLKFHPANGDKQACYRNATMVVPAGSLKIAVEQGWIDQASIIMDGDTVTFSLMPGVRSFTRTNGITGFTNKAEQTAASFA